MSPTPLPDPNSHPLAERIVQTVVDRLLGVASAETLQWERDVTTRNPEAARLAGYYEHRTRWLMDNAEDPVAKFERLTGRTLGADRPEG